MNETNVTAAADVALPVSEVELHDLKTTTGEPVRVLCERIDAFQMFAALKGLPGADDPYADDATVTPEARMGAVIERGHPLIERGTALRGPEGTLTRPAFSWSGNGSPGLPGRFLTLRDRMALIAEIIKLSNPGEGVAEAEAATFPTDQGRGTGGGGTVGAVESVGDVPVASVA